ncbi:MAG: hypothetical protein A2Z04_05580 [Chloroflexi bacterium RBG_16_57_9]|nr:MAG: hypothetical protein A2Z04_05580 [Chloroflexi bacterium RBG_16_57_9]
MRSSGAIGRGVGIGSRMRPVGKGKIAGVAVRRTIDRSAVVAAVAVAEGEGLGVGEGVGLGVNVWVAVGVEEGVVVAVGVSVAVWVGVGEAARNAGHPGPGFHWQAARLINTITHAH